MARLAATEYGADWVFSADGDEFWWPRGSSFGDVLAAVPERYGVVRCPWRPFPPRPGEGPFYERMDIRFAPQAPINEPASPYRPNSKIIHRARPDVVVERGNHALEWPPGVRELQGWHPIEILHFPIRDEAQYRQKSQAWLSGLEQQPGSQARSPHRVRAARLSERGRLGDLVRNFTVDEAARDRGLTEGSLEVDTRLRDVLRPFGLEGSPDRRALVRSDRLELTLPPPDAAADAAYASDLAVFEEAMTVRMGRLVDGLERRVTRLEAGRRRSRRAALRSPAVQVVVALTAFADAELLSAQIAFHLAAGAELVAVPRDVPHAVAPVLDPFEREGRVRRVGAPEDVDAEWLLPAPPGAFWWPRGADLPDVLGAVPSRYGVVRSVERRFAATASGRDLRDRMQHRAKAAYDGPAATRRRAGELIPLRGWRPFEVLVVPGARAPLDAAAAGAGYVDDGRLADAVACLAGEPVASVAAVAGTLEFRRPGIVADAAYALEVAELEPASAASLAEPVAELARRVAALEAQGERSLTSRIVRRLRR